MKEKICTKCKESKELIEFPFRKKINIYTSMCKICVNKRNRIWRETNKEILLVKRQNYINNNKDLVSKYNKKNYNKNIEVKKEMSRTYQKLNRDILTKKSNIRRKKRRDNDSLYNLQVRLRSRIYQALKSNNFSKCNKTNDILGTDINTLHSYLEQMFTEGMSWDNKNKWHIDHIIPLASATTGEELIKLCHYTNLQPLWAIDNLIKGSKVL